MFSLFIILIVFFFSKKNKQSLTLIEDNDSYEIGTVEFAIEYLSDTQTLGIDILRVLDLKVNETNSSSDPENTSNPMDIYCKCTLMPDKFSYQTRSVAKAADLVFEERFEFDNVDVGKLDSRFLDISVFESMPASSSPLASSVASSSSNGERGGGKQQQPMCIGSVYIKLTKFALDPKNVGAGSKQIFIKELRPSIKSEQACV